MKKSDTRENPRPIVQYVQCAAPSMQMVLRVIYSGTKGSKSVIYMGEHIKIAIFIYCSFLSVQCIKV